MTVMGSLTNIAKQRPVFFQRVVQAFEALHGKCGSFDETLKFNLRELSM